jgi:hypothetical protein
MTTLFMAERWIKILRIGLAWSGGFLPNQPETRSIKRKTKYTSSRFAPFKNLDATFYSLQKINRLIPELEKLVQVYDAQAMTVA